MTKRTILSIVVATVLLLVTFGFVYSMVLFKSNMAFEFEDAANAEEMAAAFGKGEGGLEEAGGLMSRLSFWLANWINEFAADYVSGNQMMTIVMSGGRSRRFHHLHHHLHLHHTTSTPQARSRASRWPPTSRCARSWR